MLDQIIWGRCSWQGGEAGTAAAVSQLGVGRSGPEAGGLNEFTENKWTQKIRGEYNS